MSTLGPAGAARGYLGALFISTRSREGSDKIMTPFPRRSLEARFSLNEKRAFVTRSR